MNRRKFPRFPHHAEATLEILTPPPARVDGYIVDLSRSGLGFASPVPVPVNAAIRIELPEATILGEICYCEFRAERPGHSSHYHIGVIFEEVLTGLHDLQPLLRALRAAETEPAAEPAPRR